jgi:hypothetical protein
MTLTNRQVTRLTLVGGLLLAGGVVSLWWSAVRCNWQNELESLFSGLAFVGILVTLVLQMMELKDSRTQLTRTVSAQENAEAALREQIKSLECQALLNGYTTLLEHYNEPARKFREPSGDNTIRDRSLDAARNLRARIKQLVGDIDSKSKLDLPDF